MSNQTFMALSTWIT